MGAELDGLGGCGVCVAVGGGTGGGGGGGGNRGDWPEAISAITKIAAMAAHGSARPAPKLRGFRMGPQGSTESGSRASINGAREGRHDPATELRTRCVRARCQGAAAHFASPSDSMTQRCPFAWQSLSRPERGPHSGPCIPAASPRSMLQYPLDRRHPLLQAWNCHCCRRSRARPKQRGNATSKPFVSQMGNHS